MPGSETEGSHRLTILAVGLVASCTATFGLLVLVINNRAKIDSLQHTVLDLCQRNSSDPACQTSPPVLLIPPVVVTEATTTTTAAPKPTATTAAPKTTTTASAAATTAQPPSQTPPPPMATSTTAAPTTTTTACATPLTVAGRCVGIP